MFLTIGADKNIKSLYNSFIGGLLWLNDYIETVYDKFGINPDEKDIYLKVLQQIHLPTVHDEDSICRYYASFLSSFVTWLCYGTTLTNCKDKLKTNMELSRYLSSIALNSFPSLPFTCYYIGTTKTNDHMELAEKLASCVKFTDYMTDESIYLNQPKFVVQTENTPLVGISGHPLANMIYGQINNGNTEWFGLFQESEEFEKICQKNGVSCKDIKKYMYQTTDSEHNKNIEKGDSIARFIESQPFTKELFKMRHKVYGIRNLLDDPEVDKYF